jgi:8-oxo-dGTP diphosphatase
MGLSRPPTIKKQTSSGGVVFREKNREVEVALISVRNGSIWTLPKGVVERGEDRKKTAIREVKEETGLEGEIVAELGSISYWYYMKGENTKYHKTVYYYLMEYRGGSTEEHDREVEEVRWYPIEEALSKVKYKGDRVVLKRAREILLSHLRRDE